MYRTPLGTIIKTIEEATRLLSEEANDMTKLLAETDPETYGRFLRYTYVDHRVIDTPDYIKTEIDNFDFDSVSLNKEDLSGKSVQFIFIVDMFPDEFELPLEIVNNFNYVRAWARQKVERKEQLNNLKKEFKQEA